MMKNFFKRGERKRGGFSLSSRRVAGVATGLPPGARLALTVLALVAGVLAGAWGGWRLVETYYFGSRHLFALKDVAASVTITTGKTVTPDLIREVLGLREGANLFGLSIEQKRRELLERTPNIRDLSIVRRMPDKLTVTIIEREPLARLGALGRVVDDEGVVFVRYAGTGTLPMIKGSDQFDPAKPGDRLRGKDLAAIRLVKSALRPECRLRLLVVDASKEDYLLLTFSDHRQAKFAWSGMAEAGPETDGPMQRQFDQLAQAMETEIGRGCLLWDATIPGRISATTPGLP